MQRNKIIEMQKTLTPLDVVMSTPFERFLENSANAVLRSVNFRKSINVSILKSANSNVTAYTDGYGCYINPRSELFQEDTIEDKCRIIYGALFHELGHVMYTCFTETERIARQFQNGKVTIFNLTEDEKNDYEEMKQYLLDNNTSVINSSIRDFILSSYLNISNIVEDGRIEKLLLKQTRFSGFVTGLEYLRNKHLNKLQTLENEENEINASFIPKTYIDITNYYNMLLLYSKFDAFPDGYNHDFEPFEKARPIIDNMLSCYEASKFSDYTIKLLLIIWPKVKELLSKFEENAGNDNSSGENNSSSQSENSKQQSSSNSSQNGSSSSKNEKKSSEQKNNSSTESETSEKSKDSSRNNNAGEESNNKNSDENDNSNGEDSSKTLDENEIKSILNAINKGIKEKFEESSSRSDRRETSVKEELAKNTISQNPSSITSNEGLDKIFEKIAREVAEEKVEDQVQKENRDNIKKILGASKGFAPYSGTQIIEKQPSNDRVEIDISAIKKATREIKRHLEEDMRTSCSKRNFTGKRFQAKNLVKRDFRYFDDKSRKKDLPKIKVGLVIDESGSMYSSNRYINARNAAVTLYEIFKEIPNLDIAIYGHTTSGDNVQIIQYANFGEKRKDLRKRLASISAYGGNIDIVPITVMANQLLKEQADQRILFIISDGRPYSFVKDKTPEEELTIAADKFSRKGIEIIVAAIGDDVNLIKSIYKNQKFLNISDSSMLPKKLIEVIKRKL